MRDTPTLYIKTHDRFILNEYVLYCKLLQKGTEPHKEATAPAVTGKIYTKSDGDQGEGTAKTLHT